MKQASMANESSFIPQRNYFHWPSKPISFLATIYAIK